MPASVPKSWHAKTRSVRDAPFQPRHAQRREADEKEKGKKGPSRVQTLDDEKLKIHGARGEQSRATIQTPPSLPSQLGGSYGKYCLAIGLAPLRHWQSSPRTRSPAKDFRFVVAPMLRLGPNQDQKLDVTKMVLGIGRIGPHIPLVPGSDSAIPSTDPSGHAVGGESLLTPDALVRQHGA